MNCKQYRAEIEASGFAAGGAHARAASHAADCTECRTFAEETAALRGLVGGLARVDAPADFEFRLRARIRAAEAAGTPSWSRFLRPRPAWLAAVGCLALAAALALLTRNSLTPVAPATARPPATAQSDANPAAADNTAAVAANFSMGDSSKNGVTRDSSGDVATRDTSSNVGEVEDETAGTELSPSAAGLNADVAERRRARGGVAASNVMRTQQRKADTATALAAREAVASGSALTPPRETNTLSMNGSAVIVSSAIPLPVSAGERPLQVLFKDTQGASHVVNVDPVTFGSNDPAARPTNVTFTKAAKKQGVW